MIPLLLAQLPSPADRSSMWLVVVAVSALASLGVSVITMVKLIGGKGSERQIEPTQLAAIRVELGSQTSTLININREMGEAKAGIKAVDDKITAQGEQVENAFRRINAISIESAAVKGRVDDMIAREARRHA